MTTKSEIALGAPVKRLAMRIAFITISEVRTFFSTHLGLSPRDRQDSLIIGIPRPDSLSFTLFYANFIFPCIRRNMLVLVTAFTDGLYPDLLSIPTQPTVFVVRPAFNHASLDDFPQLPIPSNPGGSQQKRLGRLSQALLRRYSGLLLLSSLPNWVTIASVTIRAPQSLEQLRKSPSNIRH